MEYKAMHPELATFIAIRNSQALSSNMKHAEVWERHYCKSGTKCGMWRKWVLQRDDEVRRKYVPPQYAFYVHDARGAADGLELTRVQENGFITHSPTLKRGGRFKRDKVERLHVSAVENVDSLVENEEAL